MKCIRKNTKPSYFVHWNGGNVLEVSDFLGAAYGGSRFERSPNGKRTIIIKTPIGEILAERDNYIVLTDGVFNVLDKVIFEFMYEIEK